MKIVQWNHDKAELGHHNWKEQFREAILVNGGDNDDNDSEVASSPSVITWIMHIITVFWKVLFAFIPPLDYCDGWVCFFCALVMIGFVTALISDLASLLGCVMGLPDAIT